MPAKRYYQKLGDEEQNFSHRRGKNSRFQGGKRFFFLVVPILVLIWGIRVSNDPASPIKAAHLGALSRWNHLQLSSMVMLFRQTTPVVPSTHYTMEISSMMGRTVQLFGLIELELKTNIQAGNPYDPNDIDPRVRFASPSGRLVEARAFWYQGFNWQTRKPSGSPGWRVRFTPDEPGEWTAIAIDPVFHLNSIALNFDVIPSDQTGFIRVNPTNSNYLATDRGDFFFPIGINMAWWDKSSDPLTQYSEWLDQFSANGGNTIRVWMAAWSFSIEWKDTGLGNYDNRQYQAWLLDQLFRLAKDHRVRIILVLVNHGPFSLTFNSEWADNPYNIALGGPLSSPEEFVTDESAITYYQQRLSYIINRWGYSPDLLAWEWFNEADLTSISDQAMIPWLQEMTAYLRIWDINQHLTTTSFSVRSWSPVFNMPELDIAQVHDYSEQLNPGERDPAARVGSILESIKQKIPLKPVLLAEFGYSAKDYGDDVENTGIHLHNGLWATTFRGYAGTGMYWWWDTYIARHDLWYQFKGLEDFIRGVDLSRYQTDSNIQITDLDGSPGQALGMRLQGATTLVWIRSNAYTVDASIARQRQEPKSSTDEPPWLNGLFLAIPGLAEGKYTVSWYDPQTATWLGKQTVSAVHNILSIPIPAFREDLAAKIIKNP